MKVALGTGTTTKYGTREDKRMPFFTSAVIGTAIVGVVSAAAKTALVDVTKAIGDWAKPKEDPRGAMLVNETELQFDHISITYGMTNQHGVRGSLHLLTPESCCKPPTR